MVVKEGMMGNQKIIYVCLPAIHAIQIFEGYINAFEVRIALEKHSKTKFACFG